MNRLHYLALVPFIAFGFYALFMIFSSNGIPVLPDIHYIKQYLSEQETKKFIIITLVLGAIGFVNYSVYFQIIRFLEKYFPKFTRLIGDRLEFVYRIPFFFSAIMLIFGVLELFFIGLSPILTPIWYVLGSIFIGIFLYAIVLRLFYWILGIFYDGK